MLSMAFVSQVYIVRAQTRTTTFMSVIPSESLIDFDLHVRQLAIINHPMRHPNLSYNAYHSYARQQRTASWARCSRHYLHACSSKRNAKLPACRWSTSSATIARWATLRPAARAISLAWAYTFNSYWARSRASATWLASCRLIDCDH